jgi:hypothetical protein
MGGRQLIRSSIRDLGSTQSRRLLALPGQTVCRSGLTVSVDFQIHPASKQAVLAMVAADVGVTLVTASQAEVEVLGVLYRPIAEPNA